MSEYYQNPQDLDDGELWKLLPSDIFPLDHQQLSSSNHNLPNYSYCTYSNSYDYVSQRLSCMAIEDRFPRGFADFSLERSPPPQNFIIPPNLKSFRPVVGCVSSGSLPVRCFTCSGCLLGTHQVSGHGIGAVRIGDVPVYPYQFVNPNPVHTQVECSMVERARILQSLHNRIVANRVVEKRILPFSGGGSNGVGYVRDYGGTGVFLPRVPANISSTTANPIINPGRRQGARNRHDKTQFLHRRKSLVTMVHMKKQEDYLSQVSPEMGLLKDWTY